MKQESLSIEGRPPVNRIHRHFLLLRPWP